jgi:hypothetical protein
MSQAVFTVTSTDQDTIVYHGVQYEFKSEDLTSLLQEGLQRQDTKNDNMEISPRRERLVVACESNPSPVKNEPKDYEKMSQTFICHEVLRTVEECIRSRRTLVRRKISKRKNGRVAPENEFVTQWRLK